MDYSKDFHTTLLNETESMIYISDPETFEILFANAALNSQFGDNIVGQKCYKVLQRREKPCPFCTNHIIFAPNRTEAYNWEYQNPITQKWYKCTDKAITWKHKKVRFEIATDITKQKETEALLRESEDKYHMLFESMNEGFAYHKVIYDDERNPVDYVYLDINPRYEEITGMPKHEIINKKVSECIPGIKNSTPNIIEQFGIVARDGTERTFELFFEPFKKWYNVSIFSPKQDYFCTIFEDIGEKKKAHIKLKKREEKYKALYNNAPLAYQSLSENGNIIDINPTWLKILGYKRTEVIGKWFGSFLHPDYVEHFKTNFPNFKEQGYINDVRFILLKKDGSEIYVSFEGCIGYDDNGKFKQTYCTFKDITEEILAKKELENSKRKLEKIFQVAPTAIGIIKNRVFFDVNHQITDITGYTPDELIGHSAIKVYPSKEEFDYVGSEKYQQIAKQGSGTVETLFQKKDGTLINILLSSTPIDSKDHSKGLIFTAQDITSIKKAEHALIEKNDQYESLNEKLITINAELVHSKQKIEENNKQIALNNERLESLLRVAQYPSESKQEIFDFALKEAIKLTDSKIGFIYFYNEKTEQFTLSAWSDNIEQGTNITNRKNNFSITETGCWVNAVRKRKPVIINHYNNITHCNGYFQEGNLKLLKSLTIPVFIENKIVAMAGVANKKTDYNKQDIRQMTLLMDNVWKITERVTLIENLNKAIAKAEESNRLKSEFLHNMSHEIRTPMNSIIGFSNLLTDDDLPPITKQRFINHIDKSCNRLLHIINDIIDISKIEAHQLSIVNEEGNLRSIYASCYETLMQNETFKKKENLQLKLNIKVARNSAFIKTDFNRYAQVLDNLLTNAIKYTTEGYVEFGFDIKTINNKKWIEAYVKDTGIGISYDKQNVIFERFRQAEEKHFHEGAGLGLSIAKGIVKILGGKIWMESQPDIGSVFYFTIPYNPVISYQTPTQLQQPQQIILNNKTILIAEDEHSSYEYLKLLLETTGAEIHHVENGQDLMNKLPNINPDILFLDINMPVKTGYECLQELNTQKKIGNLKIIVQTAYAMADEKEKCFEYGCHDYISKPYTKQEVFAAIKRVL